MSGLCRPSAIGKVQLLDAKTFFSELTDSQTDIIKTETFSLHHNSHHICTAVAVMDTLGLWGQQRVENRKQMLMKETTKSGSRIWHICCGQHVEHGRGVFTRVWEGARVSQSVRATRLSDRWFWVRQFNYSSLFQPPNQRTDQVVIWTHTQRSD